MNAFAKKFLIGLVRLCIGLGIVIFILFKINTREMLSILRESLARWPWLACGLAAYLFCLWIGIGRWKIILTSQGLRLSWARVVYISFIGQFFNSFMFGSTGGDVVRAFYAARETHHRKTEAVATVVLDRLVGLFVLNLIAGVMLIARFDFYRQHWSTHLPALLMLAMILATFAALAIIYNIRLFKGRPIFRIIERHRRFGPLVRRMLIAIYLYHRRTKVLCQTVLLSILVHCIFMAQCYCLGRSLGIEIGIIDYFTVMPIVISLSALPITPGGLGLREGLAVGMLGALDVGASQSLPFSLMIYFIAVFFSLFGGLIFLGYTAGTGRSVRDEITEFKDESARENRQVRVTGSH